MTRTANPSQEASAHDGLPASAASLAPPPSAPPPASTRPIASARRFRLLRAYILTVRITLRYLLFRGMAVALGPAWAARVLPDLSRRWARLVKENILILGGLFIKVGQLISILSNFLPEAFREELEGLQDRIPARPFDEIRRRIEAELGAPLDTLFTEIAPIPLASASLAQVHRATLPTGETVAVKVQHVGIEDVARLDLQAIRRILRYVAFLFRIRGIDAAYDQVKLMIMEELDFGKEATHLQAIAANLVGVPGVLVPGVVPERSARRVLTTTFIDGTKITNLRALEAQSIDREALAERLLGVYCKMIFTDGLYHADPHPGNLLVCPDGTLAFIDFGAVGRLSEDMRMGMPDFLEGVFRRDTNQIGRALRRMGFLTHQGTTEDLDQVLDFFYDHFLTDVTLDTWNLQDVRMDLGDKLEMILDLRKSGLSLRVFTEMFQVPKDFVLLQRTLLLLMGLCTALHPTLNPFNTIRPYIERFVLGPEEKWTTLLARSLKDMTLSAVTLPADLKRYLNQANRGEQAIRVKYLRESTLLLYALGHQLLYGLFALGSGAIAYFSHVDGAIVLRNSMLGLAALSAGLLLLSILKARKWLKR